MVCASCGSLSKTISPPIKKNYRNAFYGNNMSYKWAIPTWQFFHSFAAKINEDFYKSHKLECLNLIRNVCRSLPCPHCQQHANQFFGNVNYKNYPTKESFRQLLLAFNNDVNRRTNKPLLSREDLNKYDNSVFLNITQYFLNTIKTYRGMMGGGLADTRARDAMRNYVTTWINRYYTFFL